MLPQELLHSRPPGSAALHRTGRRRLLVDMWNHVMAIAPNSSTRIKTTAAPSRCRAIAACLGALAALLLARAAHAQAYPDRTISNIVPSSPGSSPDIVGRIMADAL